METQLFGFSLDWIPGVAGGVWIVLTVLMGIACRLLLRAGSPSSKRHARLVIGLIVFCWLYPLYTLGFQLIPGFIGNILTVLAAAWVVLTIRQSSRSAALLVLPVIVWTSVATVYVAQLLL